MKRVALIAILIGASFFALAQTPSDVSVEQLKNGHTKFSSVDALGANVFVVYNSDWVKVYQERTIADVTTFARFKEGRVIDKGTYTEPLVQQQDGDPWVVKK